MPWGRAETQALCLYPQLSAALPLLISAPQTGGEESSSNVLWQRAAEKQQGKQPEEPDEQQKCQHTACLEQEEQAEQEQHLQHPFHCCGRQRGHVLRLGCVP